VQVIQNYKVEPIFCANNNRFLFYFITLNGCPA